MQMPNAALAALGDVNGLERRRDIAAESGVEPLRWGGSDVDG